MKRLRFVLPLLVLLASPTLTAQSPGDIQFKIPPALTGNNGRVLVGTQDGLLLIGRVAGQSVAIDDTLRPGDGLPAELRSIWALSMPDRAAKPQLVHALVSYRDQSDSSRYGVMSSTDMGATWSLSKPSALAQLSVRADWWKQPLADFVWLDGNSDIGWIYGKYAIMGTTDGGATWSTRYRSVAADDQIWGLAFSDRNNGVAAMGPPSTMRFKRTSDGGIQWNNAASTLLPKRLATLDYVGDEYRALVFDRFQVSQNTLMYFSPDGNLWDQEREPVIGKEQTHMSELIWANQTDGSMILRAGEVWQTYDGGHKWWNTQLADSLSYPVPTTAGRAWGQRTIHMSADTLVHVSTVSNTGEIYRLLVWTPSKPSASVARASAADAAIAAWPNPASDAVAVRFTLERASAASAMLVDPLGRRVARHDLGHIAAGEGQLRLDVAHLPAGTYRLVLHLTPSSGEAASVLSTPVVVLP